MRTTIDTKKALAEAIKAATASGALMRRNLFSSKRANEVTQHDIKLELDVRSQKLIERHLLRAFPDVAVLGEEGVAGKQDSLFRWVVDPIDGTVNFAHSIPHACVSIALQQQVPSASQSADYPDGYNTLLGVVYEPFCNELWTAIRGQPARLNHRTIRVSKHANLADTIVAIGFSKSARTLNSMLPYFNRLSKRTLKMRIMGSAAISLSYVASGRFDAYIERSIHLWDIAAGALLIQCAGGEFWCAPMPGKHHYEMIASNGLLREQLKLPR